MADGAPDRAALRRAMDATWPAAEWAAAGGFVTGRGNGAGGRVSSSQAVGDWGDEGIAAAEAQHSAWGQPPLFRVFADQTTLAATLQARGYAPENPTAILSAPLDALTVEPVAPMTAFTVWPPLAIQREIWAAGKIGPARQAVMDRPAGPKTAILGRIDDRPAGAGFVAIEGGIAMLHALEVLAAFRRRGGAVAMMRGAAHWAAGEGARHLALAVSLGNAPAAALYARLGFAEVERYAYYSRSDPSG